MIKEKSQVEIIPVCETRTHLCVFATRLAPSYLIEKARVFPWLIKKKVMLITQKRVLNSVMFML